MDSIHQIVGGTLNIFTANKKLNIQKKFTVVSWGEGCVSIFKVEKKFTKIIVQKYYRRKKITRECMRE